MCYHTENGSSRSNRMGAGRDPKYLEKPGRCPLLWGVTDHLDKHLSTTCVGRSHDMGPRRFTSKFTMRMRATTWPVSDG